MPPYGDSSQGFDVEYLRGMLEARQNAERQERERASDIDYRRMVENGTIQAQQEAYERAILSLRSATQIDLATLNRSDFCNVIEEEKNTNIQTEIVMNNDIRTQLISRSLHEHLNKFAGKGNRLAKSLIKLNQHGYFKDSTRNVTINTDKDMTYCPAGKPTELGRAFNWVTKTRQSGKYGKVIRKLLKEQVPNLKFHDTELEDLVNKLKAEVTDGRFEIVSGDDIKFWYHGNQYNQTEDTGSLGSSCMRHVSCQDYFGIYTNNPNVVKMVILTDTNNKLIGRAILWDDKWMDRIYASDSVIERFIDYASRHGYHRKRNQCYDEMENWTSPSGEDVEVEMEFTLNLSGVSEYPYMDTFKSLNVNTGVIQNRSCSESLSLTDTDGGAENEGTWDDIDDCYIDEDDAIWIEGRDIYTHVDNCVRECTNDEWILEKDSVSDRHDDCYHEDDVIFCDGINAYVHDQVDTSDCAQDGMRYPDDMMTYIEYKNEWVADDNLGTYYCDNDFYEVDGEWQHADELFSQGYEIVDGEWVEKTEEETTEEVEEEATEEVEVVWTPKVGDTVKVLRRVTGAEEREWNLDWNEVMDSIIGCEVKILAIEPQGLKIEHTSLSSSAWYVPSYIVEQVKELV